MIQQNRLFTNQAQVAIKWVIDNLDDKCNAGFDIELSDRRWSCLQISYKGRTLVFFGREVAKKGLAIMAVCDSRRIKLLVWDHSLESKVYHDLIDLQAHPTYDRGDGCKISLSDAMVQMGL